MMLSSFLPPFPAHRITYSSHPRVPTRPSGNLSFRASLPLENSESTPSWVKTAVKKQPWKGGLEPCGEQMYEVASELVEGSIPEELNGVLYRCGPGRSRVGDQKYGHWFDGHGMVYSVSFSGPDGPIAFKSKYVKTEAFKKQEKAGNAEIVTKGAWTIPSSLFDKVGLPLNPINTSLVRFGGRLLGLSEGGPPMELDPTTLDSLGLYTFNNELKSTFSAHPKVDPVTGDLYNHGLDISVEFGLRIFWVTKEGKFRRSDAIPLNGCAFVHDICMTENYLVVIIPPYRCSILDMLTGVLGIKPLGHSFKFSHEDGNRVLVISKDSLAVVQDFVIPSFSFYHFGNGYEEDGKLHVHVCSLIGERESLERQFSDMYSSDWQVENYNTLYDLVIDMDSWQVVSKEPIIRPGKAFGMEFPQVNPTYVGRKNRYTYVCAFDEIECGKGGNFLNCLQKYDHESGEVKTFKLEDQFPSDLSFVPRHGAVSEDDGFLVTFFYDPRRHGSNVVVLDAINFDQIAIIRLPTHVPYYFHGCWVPKD